MTHSNKETRQQKEQREGDEQNLKKGVSNAGGLHKLGRLGRLCNYESCTCQEKLP